MADKTRLELDLEQRERHRTPVSIKIFIVLLMIGLCAVGFYAFHLKQELLKKEQEAILLQEYFQKEQVELLGQIKELEAETASVKSE
jgi:hypothetical protein